MCPGWFCLITAWTHFQLLRDTRSSEWHLLNTSRVSNRVPIPMKAQVPALRNLQGREWKGREAQGSTVVTKSGQTFTVTVHSGRTDALSTISLETHPQWGAKEHSRSYPLKLWVVIPYIREVINMATVKVHWMHNDQKINWKSNV